MISKNGYADGEQVGLKSSWNYADFSEINSGKATVYLSEKNRNNIIVGLNAGHGTKGGTHKKTWCHPDKSKTVTGGTTPEDSKMAMAVSDGMAFSDGTPERTINLREAQQVKEILLSKGYDVLMIRESEDVQLDNIARTVICNNVADCHISIHWDGDDLNYDKGCYYYSVPDEIKYLDSVSSVWEESERLGNSILSGLKNNGNAICKSGKVDMDLTQTSYSTIPSVTIELGNQCSDYCDDNLLKIANGLADGIDLYFSRKK